MEEPASDEEFLTPLQRIYLERNPEAKQRSSEEIEHKSLREVRGLLGWIIASMLVISPLLCVIQISMIYSRDPLAEGSQTNPTVQTLLAGSIAIFGLGSLFAGWRLAFQRVKRSVTIAIFFIAISCIVPVAVMVAMNIDISGAGPAIFWSIVWILYLLLSKRVKAVYSPDPYEAAAVFD